MNKVKCICFVCSKEFYKPVNEVNRKKKKGTNFYCSLSCAGKVPRENKWIGSEGNKQHLLTVCRNRADEFSPFRETLRRLGRRGREVKLTLPDLKEQWEKQDGKCPYLGLDLVLPQTNDKHSKDDPNLVASLDRIDSSKGYVVGNVEFISMTLNFAKNKFDKETLWKLIQHIRNAPLDKISEVC